MMKNPTPMLEKLRGILPTISANVIKAEESQKVPQQNIDLLKGIGLNRAFLPKAYGGLEMQLPEFADCIAELAIKDAFVPEHRIEKAKDMMSVKFKGFGLYPDSKIFYTPYRPYFASRFAAMSLGVAERMLTTMSARKFLATN